MLRGSVTVKDDSARIQVLDRSVWKGSAGTRQTDFKPECERLVFVDKNEHIRIEVRPDSALSGGCSKNLQIKTTDRVRASAERSVAMVDLASRCRRRKEAELSLQAG